ncbi:hypothetical protein GCM10027402_10610 [Arthrobacter monumenti]
MLIRLGIYIGGAIPGSVYIEPCHQPGVPCWERIFMTGTVEMPAVVSVHDGLPLWELAVRSDGNEANSKER